MCRHCQVHHCVGHPVTARRPLWVSDHDAIFVMGEASHSDSLLDAKAVIVSASQDSHTEALATLTCSIDPPDSQSSVCSSTTSPAGTPLPAASVLDH